MTHYYITTFAKNLTATHVAQVTTMIAQQELQLVAIKQLSEPRVERNTGGSFACYEFDVIGQSSQLDSIRTACLTLAMTENIDVSVQKVDGYNKKRKLICFDMDSTLIEQEVIVELAKAAGIGEKVSEITERAMRGEIDFNESFTQRVALLKGLSTEVLDGIAKNLTITEGAQTLINTLKAQGYHTAIMSGGFTYFANYLKEKLGIDEVHANHLDIENGLVTGKVVLPIVDGAKKAEILQNISNERNLDLAETIAVGDGANDLQMLALAGLGVAFRAKPVVRESAKQSISNLGLDGVLYLLGITEKAITKI